MKSIWGAIGAGLVMLLAGGARSAEPAGFVAATRGQAQLIRAGQPRAARIGLDVQIGDVLTTGADGRLKVLLSDDSVLALGSDSRLEIRQHLFDPARHARQTRIDLLAGSLRALVHRAIGSTGADFEVHCRTAVAGVRGTEFAVLSREPALRLVTFSGEVEWSSDGAEPVLVSAGEGSRLEQGRATRPEALAAADLAAARQATDATQAPTALAWNLGIGDRLGQSGPAGRSGFDQDHQRQQAAPPDGYKSGFDYGTQRDFGGNPGGDLGLGGPGSDRFSGDAPLANDANQELAGDWALSDERDPSSFAGTTYDFHLNLRIQRGQP